jgi:hypothetical protein
VCPGRRSTTDATWNSTAQSTSAFEETDGKVGYDWRKGSQILILTTTGRKSGEERRTR